MVSANRQRPDLQATRRKAMAPWTEVKCYSCSRVCGEVPGRGDHLDKLQQQGQLLPGPFCTLVEDQLRCSRCGSLVYPGDTHFSYEFRRSDASVGVAHG